MMTVEQEVVAVSHAIVEAIRDRDRASLDGILRHDFVQVNEGGARTERAAFLAAIEAADFVIEEIGFDWLSVYEMKGAAVACGVQRAVVRLFDGSRLLGRSAFTDVFVPEGGWKLRLATSVDLGSGPFPPV